MGSPEEPTRDETPARPGGQLARYFDGAVRGGPKMTDVIAEAEKAGRPMDAATAGLIRELHFIAMILGGATGTSVEIDKKH